MPAGEETSSPEFLTVAEIATLLSLNPQTVRNWIDAGKLPAYRVGRRVRILKADLDAVLAAGSTTNGKAPVLGAGLTSPAYTAADFWGGIPHPNPAAIEA